MPSKLNEIVNLRDRLDSRVKDAVSNAISRGSIGAWLIKDTDVLIVAPIVCLYLMSRVRRKLGVKAQVRMLLCLG